MNRLDLFSTPVWSTILDDHEHLNSILMSVAGSYTGGDYFHWAPLLKERVVPYIKDIAASCGLSDQFTVSARQNPMMPGKNNSPHHHPECMLAVVYYVEVPEN